MRGKQDFINEELNLTRITPADAGKTLSSSRTLMSKRDHPRGCGENPASVFNRMWRKGSPPRMRGKLRISSAKSANTRITPADAGKTRKFCLQIIMWQDHPRGCGENCNWVMKNNPHAGSPPRMRGKLFNLLSIIRKNRITPADAGKTLDGTPIKQENEDHPRGCGENLPLIAANGTTLGSPPRMRGKPIGQFDITARSRITPADAGKTNGMAATALYE